jgi:HSP20 family protein
MRSLVPWRREEMAKELVPWMDRPFRRMRREFESLFDRFLGRLPLLPTVYEPAWGVETEETEKEYVVRAELPGFEAPELAVEVRGEELRVRAEHKEAKKAEGEKETRYVEFERTMTLPPGVEADKIEARYHSGILEIHLPKGPEAAARRIEVKT